MIHNSLFKIRNSSESGYIALMSAIIISAVLATAVFSLSSSGFMARFNVLEREFKSRSYYLADACADAALLKKIEDPYYSGPETLTINGDNCSIISVVSSGSQYLIKSQAVIQKATTNIRLTVDRGTFSVISREEIP